VNGKSQTKVYATKSKTSGHGESPPLPLLQSIRLFRITNYTDNARGSPEITSDLLRFRLPAIGQTERRSGDCPQRLAARGRQYHCL